MADIEISYIKPFIFITGVLSLILPWFYEINFLGVFFTYQSVSLIINDLMVFGLFYLVGLSFNFIFFKYNGEINYFIGFLSLCLVIIGPIGYYALLITRLLEYQRRLDREIEFVLGPGFYFMLLTIALIVLEIYYLKKGGFALKLKVYKPKEEKEEKEQKVQKVYDKEVEKKRAIIFLGIAIVVLIIFFIIIFSFVSNILR